MRRASFWIAAGFVFLVWFYKVVLEPRPFWIGIGGDGEVVYYFNSLAIATGHRPPSVFHPGTPLQVLGAFIIKILRAGPENIQLFLNIGYGIGLVATLGAMALCSSLMAQEVSLLAGTAILLSYFLHPAAWLQLTQWGSYLFHLPLTVAGLWGLWLLLQKIERLHAWKIIGLGVGIGLACSVHLILMPMIPVGIIALTMASLGVKNTPSTDSSLSRSFARILSSLWLLVSLASLTLIWKLRSSGKLYVGFTEKMLWTFLIANAVGALADLWFFWSESLSGRQAWVRALKINWKYCSGIALGWLLGSFWVLDRLFNRYSSGKLYTGTGTPLFRQNLTALIHRAPAWWMLLVLTTFALFFTLCRTNHLHSKIHPAKIQGMGWALLTGLFLTVFLALQQADFQQNQQADGVALRYILPAAVLMTFILVWLSQFYAVLLKGKNLWIALAAMGILGLVGAQAVRDIDIHRRALEAGWKEKEAVDDRLRQLQDRLGRKPYVLMEGLSRPSCALRWGNSNADNLFDETLDRLYPEERELDYRTRNPVVPRSGHPLDFILIKESEMPTLNEAFGGSLEKWLTRIGTMERFSDGTTAPFVVVTLTNPQKS